MSHIKWVITYTLGYHICIASAGVAAAAGACRVAASGQLPVRPPAAPMRPSESLVEAAAATLQSLHALHPMTDMLDTVVLLAEHVHTAQEAAALLECCLVVASVDHADVLLSPNSPLWRVLYVWCLPQS